MESIETLLNSIDNLFRQRQIDVAANENLWDLVILGIHAMALTISEVLFGKAGVTGFKLFLENFVDEDKSGFDYSQIAEKIHDHRNIVAHQWLSEKGYEFGYDGQMTVGWQKRDGVVYLNPKLYYKSFKKAFSAGGKIWKYREILTPSQLEDGKKRFLDKYEKQ